MICVVGLWGGAAVAQSPIDLTIGTETSGATIPDDFVGLSFGMKALLPKEGGTHFFSATNTSLITLFQNVGITHLRVGGTTVESPVTTPIPGETDIDNLFAFVRAARVKKVIYSLRLLEPDPAMHYAETNAVLAKYIWSHYRSNLDCFALGNEPDLRRVYNQDWAITNFTTYIGRWEKFASAISNAVPEAKFAGPDASSGNVHWTIDFADAEKNSGLISAVVEHFYVGGAGRGLSPAEGIETMLSPDWIKANQTIYDKVTAVVLSNGLPFRFTEANDHYTGGVPGGSDTFAGALWALDFLHWWAAHDAKGVDFHNTQWAVNGALTLDAQGRVTINPKAYGLAVFNLGGHGRVQPISISNPDGVNLTAYAVRDGGNLFVTIINKDHGAGARGAEVTIRADGMSGRAEAMFLTAPGGDAAAKTDVMLGGKLITNDGPWRGKWVRVKSAKAGEWRVGVEKTSAVVVRIGGR